MPDPEPAGLQRRIVLAHLRGVARGHGDRVNAFRAQRIDCDAQRQRRIDAAGKPNHDAGKAMLLDIVAGTEDERPIDTLFL